MNRLATLIALAAVAGCAGSARIQDHSVVVALNQTAPQELGETVDLGYAAWLPREDGFAGRPPFFLRVVRGILVCAENGFYFSKYDREDKTYETVTGARYDEIEMVEVAAHLRARRLVVRYGHQTNNTFSVEDSHGLQGDPELTSVLADCMTAGVNRARENLANMRDD